MPNDKDLEKIIKAVRKRNRERLIKQNKGRLHHQTQRNYSNRDVELQSDIYLNSIVFPLSEAESTIYIDGLLDRVVNERIDRITSLIIYTFQEDLDNVQLCKDISQAVLSYKDQFPEEYSTNLSKKEKTIGLSLMASLIPTSILEFMSKNKIQTSGDIATEKYKVLSGAANLVNIVKVVLGFGGALVGAGAGSLAGAEVALLGGMGGFVVGYFSPAIVGGTYMMLRKKSRISEREEYDRIRNAIDNISNQVRLQEVPLMINVLPDFLYDNIYPYLSRDATIPFREPERRHQDEWIINGFKSIVDREDIFNRATFNMQKYYRAKTRNFELQRV